MCHNLAKEKRYMYNTIKNYYKMLASIRLPWIQKEPKGT